MRGTRCSALLQSWLTTAVITALASACKFAHAKGGFAGGGGASSAVGANASRGNGGGSRNRDNTALVAGVGAGALVIFLLAISFLCYKRRKNRYKSNNSGEGAVERARANWTGFLLGQVPIPRAGGHTPTDKLSLPGAPRSSSGGLLWVLGSPGKRIDLHGSYSEEARWVEQKDGTSKRASVRSSAKLYASSAELQLVPCVDAVPGLADLRGFSSADLLSLVGSGRDRDGTSTISGLYNRSNGRCACFMCRCCRLNVPARKLPPLVMYACQDQ